MKLINEKLDYGKFWQPNQVVIFTANSTLTKDGRLVMGAGAAKECRDNYKDIDKVIGHVVRIWMDLLNTDRFHYMEAISKSIKHENLVKIGAFQTKCDWREKSSIDLVKSSTECLQKTSTCNPNKEFHMNFPGINYGGLSVNSVAPIIKELPDNVFVYKI